MKSIKTNQKLNNEGFTLIELLVSMAISGIVIVLIAALMTNGSLLFKTESEKIDVQNELQVVDTFITETIMEAKMLDIVEDSEGTLTLYTGIRGSGNELLAVPSEDGLKTTERIITYDPENFSMYITDKYIADIPKGYQISNYVRTFKVSIDDSCKTYRDEVPTGETEPVAVHKGYSNPIILNIDLVVGTEDRQKVETMRIVLRNKIDMVTVNGTEYNVE